MPARFATPTRNPCRRPRRLNGYEISRICSYFVSGASRDRTGDLLLAKWALRPLTRCHCLPQPLAPYLLPDGVGIDTREHHNPTGYRSEEHTSELQSFRHL